METVDNHATMRKSFPWSGTYFSLATLTYFLLISRKMWSKSCGKVCNLVWFFESVLRSDLLVSLGGWEISSKVSLLKGHILSSISWNHFHLIWISYLFKGSSCGCVWRPRDLAQLVSFYLISKLVLNNKFQWIFFWREVIDLKTLEIGFIWMLVHYYVCTSLPPKKSISRFKRFFLQVIQNYFTLSF